MTGSPGLKLTGACRVEPREFTPPSTYVRRTVETMSDREIRNKLCVGVRGGCKRCDVYDTCRYGREAMKRGMLK